MDALDKKEKKFVREAIISKDMVQVDKALQLIHD